jgi:type IV pilus assembly protein PilO
MTGNYPTDGGFTTEGFVPPPSGPPVIAGIELTPMRIGIAVGSLGVLAAGLLAFINLRPLLEEIQTVEAEIVQLTAQLTQTEQQVAALPEVPVLEGRLVAARAANEEISRLLPNPENIDTQLIDVTRLMELSATGLRSFVPSARTAGGEGVPAPLAAQIQVQNSTISMRGTYEDIIGLMNNIERLETLLQVSNLSIQFDTANAPELGATFNLTAYIYDENAAPTPAAAPEVPAS